MNQDYLSLHQVLKDSDLSILKSIQHISPEKLIDATLQIEKCPMVFFDSAKELIFYDLDSSNVKNDGYFPYFHHSASRVNVERSFHLAVENTNLYAICYLLAYSFLSSAPTVLRDKALGDRENIGKKLITIFNSLCSMTSRFQSIFYIIKYGIEVEYLDHDPDNTYFKKRNDELIDAISQNLPTRICLGFFSDDEEIYTPFNIQKVIESYKDKQLSLEESHLILFKDLIYAH